MREVSAKFQGLPAGTRATQSLVDCVEGKKFRLQATVSARKHLMGWRESGVPTAERSTTTTAMCVWSTCSMHSAVGEGRFSELSHRSQRSVPLL